LATGTPFQATLLRGLEFRLSASWDISVGPVAEPNMDYLWVVSPPVQMAPHRMIGPGYGMSARESARIERPLRFVLTRSDYDAARAAMKLESAGDTLNEMERLGRGRLSFTITDYRIRDEVFADGRKGDAFEWIAFKAEACVSLTAAPMFRDFLVSEVFRDRPAVPVLATPDARRFRTELTRQAAAGPNFAGFYTFARWGCGAGCVTGAIIDSRTGQVWFPKFRVEDSIDASGKVALHHGSSFQLDSELVIAEGVINERGAGTAYFRWREGKMQLILFDRLQ